MKQTGILALVVLTLLFSGVALAQEMMPPSGAGGPGAQPGAPMMHQPMMPGMTGPQMMGPGAGMMGPQMGHMMGMMPGAGMHPWWGARSRRGPGFFLGLRGELGLNEGQVNQLRELRSAYLKEAVLKQAAVRVAEIELRELLTKDVWDVAKAEEKVKEISALRADTRLARLRALAQAREVLTPEQRKKFQELQERQPWPQGFRRS